MSWLASLIVPRGNRLEAMKIRMMLLHLLRFLAGMLFLVAHPPVVMVAITTAVRRAILALLYAVAWIVQLRQGQLEPVVGLLVAVWSAFGLVAGEGGLAPVLAGVGGPKHIWI